MLPCFTQVSRSSIATSLFHKSFICTLSDNKIYEKLVFFNYNSQLRHNFIVIIFFNHSLFLFTPVHDRSGMSCLCANVSAECTLLVCPGFANSSETKYIRTFVQFARDAAFRVAVLNHLGAIRDIPLTAPRIFTFGMGDFTRYTRTIPTSV